MDLLQELEHQIVCGDGAMGTLLLDQGLPLESCLEEVCISDGERVLRIHEQYIEAGARLIETNSFGANGVRLARFGLENRVAEINRTAAGLALKAAGGRNVHVAGSVGPLGISALEAEERNVDRASCFREQMAALLEAGVEILFLETFMDDVEMEIALAVKNSLSDCTTICSFACEPEGRLASGATLSAAFERVRRLGAHITGVNCMNGPHGTVQLLKRIALDGILAAFPNAGYPKYTDGRFIYYASPEYFAQAAQEMVREGARLIGGCCGTKPRTIHAMVQATAELVPVRSKPVRVIETPAAPTKKVSGAPEESLLDKIAAGKRIVISELDPPKSLLLEKFFLGAQELVTAGCDAITLADNSLAILRVSNLAIGAMLRERFGITPLLHLSCRDRNVLGLQSELLGMAALGLRHVLPVTGDPARVGDHPGASSVYDVNSIELIAIIQKLNRGFSHVGKSLQAQTQFVVGGTFNPNARNLDSQVNRLERKVSAGATYVMTQPIFDPRLVEETYQRTEHLKIPIFMGVWPLQSARQTEFLHNEVPGIVIPAAVRERMARASKEQAREEGLEIAQQITREVLACFPGIYLITPFLHFESTGRLARFARQI